MVRGLAAEVGRHLPYLRRYARAMTGDQAQGDAAVRACLEWILDDPGRLDPQDVRVSLYRALHESWSGVVMARAGQDTLDEASIVASRIGQLPEARRRILLLATLEGFSLAQIAAIMPMELATVQRQLVAAKSELRAQPSTRVLII